MMIDWPTVSGPWRPASPWAARLDAARTALDAARIDLSNGQPDPDEADRAALVAAYRRRYGL